MNNYKYLLSQIIKNVILNNYKRSNSEKVRQLLQNIDVLKAQNEFHENMSNRFNATEQIKED